MCIAPFHPPHKALRRVRPSLPYRGVNRVKGLTCQEAAKSGLKHRQVGHRACASNHCATQPLGSQDLRSRRVFHLPRLRTPPTMPPRRTAHPQLPPGSPGPTKGCSPDFLPLKPPGQHPVLLTEVISISDSGDSLEFQVTAHKYGIRHKWGPNC